MSTQTAVAPYHDKEAWLEEREPCVGSTDIAAILGKDPYKTDAKVWDRIVLGEREEVDGGDVRRGTKQEPIAVETFCDHYGLTLSQVRRHPMRRHSDYPWMVTDVDRMIVTLDEWPEAFAALMEPQEGPGAMEVKVPRVPRFYEFRDDGLPLTHVVQHQHHFAVTGWRWGIFAFYTPEYDDLIAFPVLRDDEFIDLMIPRVVRWWERHVVAKERPTRPAPGPPKWPERPKGVAERREDPAWQAAADFYRLADSEAARTKINLEAAEEQIGALLEDGDQHVAGGGIVVKRYSTAQQRRFDTKAFLAAVKLAQQEGDADALLELDPDDDAFYYLTNTREKINIKSIGPAKETETS